MQRFVCHRRTLSGKSSRDDTHDSIITWPLAWWSSPMANEVPHV